MALNQAVILAANWSSKISLGLAEFLGVDASKVSTTKNEGANNPEYTSRLSDLGSATYAGRIVGSLDDDNVDVVLKCTSVGGQPIKPTTDLTSFRTPPKKGHDFDVPDTIVLRDLDQFV